MTTATETTETFTMQDIRILVENYYDLQESRKRYNLQFSSVGHASFKRMADVFQKHENGVKKDIATVIEGDHMADWARSHCGIDIVLAAGLVAHIDITKCPCQSSLRKFAGLAPPASYDWGKGKKRPWNAFLKTLCYKIGESFVKNCNNPKCFYGQLYADYKLDRIAQNDSGAFAEAAAEKLENFRIGKKTDAYKHYSAGHLPPAHVHARARHWVVQQFLNAYFEEAWRHHYGTVPPNPYVVSHLHHVHKAMPKPRKAS